MVSGTEGAQCEKSTSDEVWSVQARVIQESLATVTVW